MIRRRLLTTGLAASALALAGCGDHPAASRRTDGLEAVRFNMSWLPQGSMGGVIAAIDKGYYAEVGLQVTPMRGFGGIRTANELDQGMFEFAYGDPVSVALNRSRGGKTRMVAPLHTRWPAGVCFVTERRRIARPADLVGLTLGGGQNSPMQKLVPAWLKRNGVDPARVTILQLDPSVVATSLIEGKIDAAECWAGNSLPVFRKRAQQAGVTIGWLPYSAFNLDIYGSGLLTTERLLSERPETVRRFVAATQRGYAYAAEHPDEVAALMARRYPTLDLEITRQQIVETAGLTAGAEAFVPGRIERSIGFLEEAYPGEGARAVTGIFETAPPAS